MKTKDKKLLFFLAALAAITVAGVTLRTVACLTDLELASGHFKNGTLYTVSAALTALGIGIAIAYSIFSKPGIRLVADFHCSAAYVMAGLLGAGFIFFATDAAARAITDELLASGLKLVLLATALFAIVSVGFLFLYPFLGRRYSEIRGFAGIGTVVCLALYSVYLLADGTKPMNDPTRIVDQLAFISAALFFLGEVRLSLGREMWRIYTSVGMAASLLTAYSSIPSLIFYFANASSASALLSKSVADIVLTLVLFLFISSRTVKVAFLKSDEQGTVAKAVSNMADAKREATAEPDETDANDENQISIDDIIAGPDGYSAESETKE